MIYFIVYVIIALGFLYYSIDGFQEQTQQIAKVDMDFWDYLVAFVICMFWPIGLVMHIFDIGD